MKISFTGTQQGMTEFQKLELARLLKDEFNCSELIHGECMGADYEATEVAISVGVKIFHLFPGDIKAKNLKYFPASEVGKAQDLSGIIYTREKEEKPTFRNIKIVDAGEILIAAPKEHTMSVRSGTWATVRYAWRKRKKVIVIPPIIREEETNNE